MPAQPQSLSLARRWCGALSVPRKNLALPEVAARRSASRCFSRLATGRQYLCGLIPPTSMALRLMWRCCGVIVAATFAPAPFNECHRVRGRDVLEDHLAASGRRATKRRHHPLDEHRLAVEDVDIG